MENSETLDSSTDFTHLVFQQLLFHAVFACPLPKKSENQSKWIRKGGLQSRIQDFPEGPWAEMGVPTYYLKKCLPKTA